MKILHIIAGDQWAGAEAQVYYTLKGLSKKPELDIYTVLFNEGELYDRLYKENIDICVIDENRFSGLNILKKIKKIIKEYKPDIIHTHKYKGHILSSIAAKTTRNEFKIVRTIHGKTYAPFNFQHIKSYFLLKIEDYFLKHKTDCIIAVSKTIEKLFRDRYSKTRIVQINNAVEIPTDLLGDCRDTRRQFGVEEKTFWVGTAARLVPVKNIDMLIESARILKKAGADFKVSIFGNGPLKEKLNSKIRCYGLERVVELHGHYDKILEVMNALDVFVLTSKNEGLPMSLVEAMAAGTVPVCTMVGGMQEVIENGENGYLVELNNNEEFSRVLLLLYNDKIKRECISTKAKERIIDKYSNDKSTEMLLSLYRSVIKEK